MNVNEVNNRKRFLTRAFLFGKIKGISCWPDLNHEPFQLNLQ